MSYPSAQESVNTLLDTLKVVSLSFEEIKELKKNQELWWGTTTGSDGDKVSVYGTLGKLVQLQSIGVIKFDGRTKKFSLTEAGEKYRADLGVKKEREV